MVKTNNEIQKVLQNKLSIQISLNGLSFCCKNLASQEIYDFQKLDFQNFPASNSIEENLWLIFSENKPLITKYDCIEVLFQNNLQTWIPKQLFDVSQIGSYLQFNAKVFPTDFFAHDAILDFDYVNVYVPYMNIINFLLDQFKEFEYQHHSTVLLRELLKINSNSEEPTAYIYFEKNQFQLIVLKNTQLLFFNTFEFQTENDVLYYLLFIAEQLSLNPDQFELFVLGKMNENEPIFEKIYQFVRNVKMLPMVFLKQKFGRSEDENIENFVLFNL